jgi:tetratricopeptide (TPR) repeat protein
MLKKFLMVFIAVALSPAVAILQAEIPAQNSAQNSNAASLQGENLLSLGFYAGAEEAFRLAMAASPTSENVRGLLRALLAQEKPADAEGILNSAAAEKLNNDQKDFYRMLVGLQEETSPGMIDLKDAGLDPAEKHWLSYIRGLQAFKKGDFAGAEAMWRGLPQNSEEELWALAMMPENSGHPLTPSLGEGENNGAVPQTPFGAKGALTPQQGKASRSDASMNSPRFQPRAISDDKNLQKRLSKLRPQDWPIVKNYLLGMLARGENEKARNFIMTNAAKLPRDESGLIVALSCAQNTPERAEALMKALPSMENKRLLAIAVGLCQNETAINMGDVERQLGERKKDAAVALVLAQGWIQKGSLDHAYELLSAASADTLPAEWREAYFSTVATLAEGTTPRRYREAANALIRWRDLPTTMRSEAATLQRQIADAYFKNGDFADAAGAYEKDKSLGLQAVLAWLKADKPDEAKRVLMSFSPIPFPQAMLAYLMYIHDRGGDVEAAYKIFAKSEMPMSERWPIEYLRIDSLASASPSSNANPNANLSAALDKLLALKDLPEDAPCRVYFDLEKYRLFTRLGRKADADKMLDEVMRRKAVPREFALLAIERDLMDQRPEAAMELLPQAQTLPPADRVSLMMLVADSLGNTPEALQKVQAAIDFLPPTERVGRMAILAKRWAFAGNLDRAKKIVDALEESSIAGDERDEVDFLRATLDELSGNPAAEGELIALSERPEADVKLRGLARLAAYDAEHGKIKEAKEIFYSKLSGLTAKPLPASLRGSQEEVLKAFVSIAAALPDKDGWRVKEWVEENE